MKELQWKNMKGEWIVHYSREDNDIDVKEWEDFLEKHPTGQYRIVTKEELKK